nr:MAG TPA: hypothetical protein [Caudoviricetes sp.]
MDSMNENRLHSLKKRAGQIQNCFQKRSSFAS